MIPPHLLQLVLSGPKTPAGLVQLATFAVTLRAAGHVVLTPVELARRAGATWGSVAYARETARAILDSDALLLTPDWEECEHACACEVQAEALRLPVYEYDETAQDFLPAA